MLNVQLQACSGEIAQVALVGVPVQANAILLRIKISRHRFRQELVHLVFRQELMYALSERDEITSLLNLQLTNKEIAGRGGA